MKKLIVLFSVLLVLVAIEPASAVNIISNGSFESGDFTGWGTQDLNAPFWPLLVRSTGTLGPWFFPWNISPADGTWAASHGFDGDGSDGSIQPNTIEIFQDLNIGPGLSATLTFDYRAAWDMTFGASLARSFDVEIQPFGGGAPLFSTNIFTALPGTINNDTGSISSTPLNLDAFIGQSIRLNFISTIPENFTGPGQFQIDNVVLDVEPIPEPTSLLLFGSGLIGLAGFRRRLIK